MPKLVIIDGNAIIHRAYHALPPMTTKAGLLVNAAYGFTSMLLKVLQELKPTHLAVTFDMAGPTFRHEQYKEYKAKRVKADQELYDQIPLAHEITAAFGIPVYEKSGYEADDVIGTIIEKFKIQSLPRPFGHELKAEWAEPRGAKYKIKDAEAIVVTGDMDALQLVADGVKVYALRKGLSDAVLYDAAAVQERYGFKPEQLVDYKALAGDASDNIPGVPGIGEKTATELIKQFGGIEGLYKKIRNPKSEIRNQIRESLLKKLIEGEESSRMSRQLATIERQVPGVAFDLGDCELKEFDRAKITPLFQRLEFVSLLKRLPGGVSDEVKTKKLTTKKGGVKFKWQEAASPADAAALLKNITAAKRFACRALISGNDIFGGVTPELLCAVGDAVYWVRPEATPEVLSIFKESEIELVGHNLKQLVKILCVQAVPPLNPLLRKEGTGDAPALRRRGLGGGFNIKNRLFDAMIASYLLQPGSRSHDVGSVVLKTLGKELPVGSNQTSLFGSNPKALAEELWLVAQATPVLKNELEQANNLGLFTKIEMPLISVLAAMELNGVCVDTNKLKALSKEVAGAIGEASKKIFKLAGSEFNISSPLQLREILFDKLQIPVEGLKKGKTGLSTDAEQLEKLKGLHPIIDLIGEYRELAKLQNTYIDVLPTLINKTTGRIHTTFNQAVAATGRLSSSDPNLQNIPIRTELGREIRKAFVAPPGYQLVSADYSQIELRIVASLAEDKQMLKIFERGEDIHTATAAAINGVPLNKVTKDMRRAAKEINFGILYGMGTYGLSWRAEIPAWEAKEFIAKYFREFAGVKKYINTTLAFTTKEGFCETLFGRRRYLPELNSGNFQLRAAAERMAINHPIQGTAADLMKLAMIEVHDAIASPALGGAKPASPASRASRGGQSPDLPNQLVSENKGITTHSTLLRVALSEVEMATAAFGGLAMTGDIKMILQVHDELVFEVHNDLVPKIKTLLKKTMEGVVKLRVPVVVEVASGKNWGELH